jgi:hypothetical protein
MNHTLKVILDEGPRPKGGKLKQYPRGTYFGRKINWFRPKNSVKRRTFDLENQELGYGPRYVQLKDSMCFKSIQIGS